LITTLLTTLGQLITVTLSTSLTTSDLSSNLQILCHGFEHHPLLIHSDCSGRGGYRPSYSGRSSWRRTMSVKQGDLKLLEDSVAKDLMQSKIPARLAHIWTDGTFRVVPIWFPGNGREFALATPPRAPTLKLARNPKARLQSTTTAVSVRYCWCAGQSAWRLPMELCPSMR
jgi:hypothetical protein